MNKIVSHFYFFNFTYPARVPLERKKQINFFIIVSRSVVRGVILSSEGKCTPLIPKKKGRNGTRAYVCAVSIAIRFTDLRSK